MTDQWHYGRGADITGPVSGAELSDLATSGRLRPTDTVWEDGVEAGVPAGQVEYLFSAAALMADEAAPDAAAAAADPPVAAPPPAPAAVPPPPRKTARASAGKGAVLVGQDGTTVKFRGKCPTCRREDASWKSVPIPRGTLRTSFFCPKCRKRQDVEIHGYQ
jgi:hypothetical protein